MDYRHNAPRKQINVLVCKIDLGCVLLPVDISAQGPSEPPL